MNVCAAHADVAIIPESARGRKAARRRSLIGVLFLVPIERSAHCPSVHKPRCLYFRTGLPLLPLRFGVDALDPDPVECKRKPRVAEVSEPPTGRSAGQSLAAHEHCTTRPSAAVIGGYWRKERAGCRVYLRSHSVRIAGGGRFGVVFASFAAPCVLGSAVTSASTGTCLPRPRARTVTLARQSTWWDTRARRTMRHIRAFYGVD